MSLITAAKKDKNPDPIAAIISIGSVKAKRVVISITTTKKDENPDPIATIVLIAGYASASAVIAAACCSEITHKYAPSIVYLLYYM